MFKDKNTIIVGLQYSDEGKGRIVDVLSDTKKNNTSYKAIVRYNGGPNAGHNIIINGEKVNLQGLPVGVAHDITSVIAQDSILDPVTFKNEVLMVEKLIGKTPDVKVSAKSHLIMPYHKTMSCFREYLRDENAKIGSTKLGIGPCQEDKYMQIGIRAGDVFDEEKLALKIKQALSEKNVLFKALGDGKFPEISYQEVFEFILPYCRFLQSFVDFDVESFLEANNKHILFEGAHGLLIDIDHGTYPYVTSSYCSSAYAYVGSGLGLNKDFYVMGALKPYSTRVGEGPLAHEIDVTKDAYKHLFKCGDEIESTTKRNQRIAWLSLDDIRKTSKINGVNGIALTKLDVLTGLETVFIYDEENNKKYEIQGWNDNISHIRDKSDLPKGALEIIDIVEKCCNVPVVLVSLGVNKDDYFLVG